VFGVRLDVGYKCSIALHTKSILSKLRTDENKQKFADVSKPEEDK
jgi:hypothetical protein